MVSNRNVSTDADEKFEPKLKKFKVKIRTKFEKACKKGDIEAVKHCLKLYFDIDARNQSGMTLLHLASKMGHAEIVAEILKHGANINKKNKRGFSALHIASKKGFVKVVDILLASGAKIDLHIGHNPEGCEGCEMPKGDFCYPNGSALHLASKYGHVDVVKLLLNHGAVIKTSRCSISSLQTACENGHIEVVKELLKNGANLNKEEHVDPDPPPLHTAVLNGKIELVQELVKLGADINYRDYFYGSPINIAAEEGNLALVRELMKLGVNPYQYLEKGDDDGFLNEEKALEEILLYHENDAIVNANNKTPLHWAVQMGYTNVVQKLLERGCNANVKTTDNVTPLHDAIESPIVRKYDRGFRVVSILLKYGADVNAKDILGDTPLHDAVKENHELFPLDKNSQLQLLKMILEEGTNIDFNIKNVNGKTALQITIDERDTDFVSMLLKYGAPLKVRNEDENMPLECALITDSSMKLDFMKVIAFHLHNSNM